MLFNDAVNIRDILCRVDDRIIKENGTFGRVITVKGKRSTGRKPASEQIYTTIPRLSDQGPNSDRPSEKPATQDQS
jgi:hypothetical protein